MTSAEYIATGLGVLGFIIAVLALYWGVLYPRFWAPKPYVTCGATPHWISPEKTLAAYDLVIKNEGSAPAKDIGLYLELKSPFLIQNIQNSPVYAEKTWGEETPKVELRWNELSPGNLIHTTVIYDTSEKIEHLYPERYKVWFKDKLVDSSGM
ncbi:hypothetical protein ES708_14511 [subsurface metagenome]